MMRKEKEEFRNITIYFSGIYLHSLFLLTKEKEKIEGKGADYINNSH